MDEPAVSRTITDPPDLLIRIAVDATGGPPPPGYQALYYFEADTDALRWLADLDPAIRVLSVHRLTRPGGLPGLGGLAWRRMQYQPPGALGSFTAPLEEERIRTMD
jgi:hypothetical protein